MDTPLATSLFRQLFRHRPCVRNARLLPRTPITPRRQQQCRTIFAERDDAKAAASAGEWQPKSPFLQIDMSEEFKRYPMVTAAQLANRKERPRRVKMLVRDYIDDALYNPHYGYFSKHAVIFETKEPFNFPAMKDEIEFHQQLAEEYTQFEDKLDAEAPNPLRQLWHTPTELFKPYYGEAIARYLVTNYKLSLYPYRDLIIYEMGAGNGTMMSNVLDYIRESDPEVYARTRYKVIEISEHLAGLQRKQADAQGHADKIEIVNKSVFDWDTYVPDPCFFLALEVFDNFAHDMIRYHPETEVPYQGIVLCDQDGDFHDFYTPHLDPVAERFLRVRDHVVQGDYQHPLNTPKIVRRLKQLLPSSSNLTVPEYIPTKAMMFFDVLRERFPAHRLVMSDFSSLPDAVSGVNSPVVQTRYERETIAVTTPFVQQGYFDILFPTDFDVMDDMYKALTGKLTRVMKHEDFMSRWAYLEETQTNCGENPLLGWYKNVSMLSSV
ncbi:S-adenosyl-L-methionine-dependent methyltransferase [Tricharina praecox]|uniref:S-adenosyl-L-methionine-dependent methyltransferase n=1 Tax=Tricharina praecox TaxID=43433 RepID=UPI00221F627B|nr:S-adenosyl-L-methionine-dependent methyltransferase [Tricharina praecox]KAI5846934.1 S-adenosyl-L-methionine-dependent methyltransferase [Tricharina praecox]